MSYAKLTIAVAALVLAAGAGEAAAKHRRHHHVIHAPPPPYVAAPFFPRVSEPARMIEVKPGYIISTYDCVTDEGGGRLRPCSAGPRR